MDVERFERILVCRSDRIGDLVLTLPLLAAIRRVAPHAHVGAFVSAATAPLLEGNPDVDEVIVDERAEGPSAFLRQGRALKAHEFDTALMPFCTWRVASLAVSAGIRRRVANGFRSFLPLVNRPLWLHRSHPPIHETDYCLAHLKALGYEPGAATHPRIHLTEAERDEARAFLLERGLDPSTPLVGLHPGSGGSALSMSPDRWVRAARLAMDVAGSSRVVVTGSLTERPLADRIAAALGPAACVVAGEMTLRGLVAVQSLLAVVLAPSTGPLHTAAAVGTRVMGFYPPLRSQSIRKWRPLGPRVGLIQPEPDECERCTKERCPRFPCMDTLSDEVVGAALERLFRL